MNPIDATGLAPAGGRALDRQDELHEAAQQFESLFLQSLISRMRQSQLSEGFFGSEAGSDVYEGMFEQFMARQLATDSPLGIADMLLEQWTSRGEGLDAVQDALRRVGTIEASRSYESVIGPSGNTAIPEPASRPAQRASRGFGWGTDPINGERRFHEGIDLPAVTGTAVRSLRPGRVTHVDRGSGYGLQVVVLHPDGLATRYAHLSRAEVAEGQRVSRGQTLGEVGSTGRSTGPHLHFEISRNGEKVDPGTGFGVIRSQVLGRDADPVTDGNPGPALASDTGER